MCKFLLNTVRFLDSHSKNSHNNYFTLCLTLFLKKSRKKFQNSSMILREMASDLLSCKHRPPPPPGLGLKQTSPNQWLVLFSFHKIIKVSKFALFDFMNSMYVYIIPNSIVEDIRSPQKHLLILCNSTLFSSSLK